MDLSKFTLIEYVEKIKSKEFSALQGVEFFAQKIKSNNHNAVLEVFKNSAILQAQKIDDKIKKGEKLGCLAGAPIIIKDNILFKGHKASAGSKILQNFISPYSATVVEKLVKEDAIILGRANMDEFGMGSTGENSAYGATHNAHAMNHVAGGSSSGSAVAVACGLCVAAIGTDTGASVRTPAAYNGLFAIKPTYGAVSRYGVIAYASGLEQVGPICKTAGDTKLLFNVIKGKDEYDGTTISAPQEETSFNISALKIGYIEEIWQHTDVIEDFDKYQKLFSFFKEKGAQVKEISIKNIDLALPAYYIIATAEAASNLARYDGVKYTSAAQNTPTLEELYKKTRSEFFGSEVKRRIMLGNFVLSSGYFDAYYGKAKKVQSALKDAFTKAFEECDCIIMPVTLSDALKMGEKTTNPVEMYLEDLFTVPANVAGVPAITVPFAKGKKGLPIGFQILSRHFNENLLFETAKFFENNCGGGIC